MTSKTAKGSNQGCRNRYNLINCEHGEITFMCFEKTSLIEQQLPVNCTKQQFKFVERFFELGQAIILFLYFTQIDFIGTFVQLTCLVKRKNGAKGQTKSR